jgi:hypothetical protein
LILAGCLSAAAHVDARAGFPHLWSQRFTGPDYDEGHGVATDASGNVFVAGTFASGVDFGGGTIPAGGSNVFVAKYNSAGVHQWSRGFGDGLNQECYSIATDPSGNVIIVGFFKGTINFGGANLASAAPTTEDIFVAKFNSAGVHQWSQRFGDTAHQWAISVATDASANVIVTGYFVGTVNFGGADLTSAGAGYDIYLAKFNSAGVHQWSQRFGNGFATQFAASVAMDGNGNVLLTGTILGTVNFGGADLVGAGSDVFLAKFNSAGVHQWSQRFGDSDGQNGGSVVTDGSDNVLLTGGFSGTVNFGGADLVGMGSDVFLAKFNSAGVHQWSQRFGDSYHQFGHSVATDGSDNVLLTGGFIGTIDFGGGNLASGGFYDIFVAKLTPLGSHVWSQRFGDSLEQVGYSVASDPGGRVIITGWSVGTVNFGGSNLLNTFQNPNSDAFLAMFGASPGEPSITSILDFGNDQGRAVRIRFQPSGADDPAASVPIVQYEAFRRIDSVLGASPTAARAPAGMKSELGLLASDWEFAGTIPAYGASSYFMVAPTLADSTPALGQHHSAFFIRAATDIPSVFYDSLPDSGYSLDNLAPGAPSSFAYSTGQLDWDESSAEDFDYFSVYGSNTSSFAAATLIDYTVAPALDVTASPYAFYFATATDFSGNEGQPAVINTLSAVSGTPRSYVLSISSYPNPFNPETVIRFTLPSRGRAKVTVYDARGAFVVALVDEEKGAGAHTREWDGTDSGGKAVSSGVYFAQVSHPSGRKSYKMVLLK